MNKAEAEVMEKIPSKVDAERTLQLIYSAKSKVYLRLLKSYTNEDDEELSDWLDISVKTFRNYKDNFEKEIKASVKEHVIVIMSLMKHGAEVFGNYTRFKEWLDKENFYLDKKRPIEYLSSISGMKFIDDRLTAIEFGDNS